MPYPSERNIHSYKEVKVKEDKLSENGKHRERKRTDRIKWKLVYIRTEVLRQNKHCFRLLK